jgi:hypothetical protein
MTRTISTFIVTVALASSGVAACDSSERAAEPAPMTPAGRPLSAEEHRELARQEEARAERESDKLREPGKKGSLERQEMYERAEAHREHAEEHQRAAAALERFEAAECQAVPEPERAACPFLGVEDTTTIDKGVRVTLHAGRDVNDVLARMQCHAAFARAQGYQGMEHCPIYHRGVQIRLSPDGNAIDITSDDPNVAAEVQHEVETHYGD